MITSILHIKALILILHLITLSCRNTLMMPRTSRDDQKYIVLSVHHGETTGMLRQTSEGDIPTSKLN